MTAALNPVLDLMGHTLLATPDVTAQSRVAALWQMAAGAADSALVLFVLIGAAVVMAHETLQVRWALKEIAPRIVVAAIAVNASLGLAGLAISTAGSVSQALLGQGVGPAQAAVVLQQLVLGSLANQGIFLVLVGAVVAVLAVVLLATFVIRVALVVLLVVAAPVALVCHALPQTEGLARLWWRAFAGLLAVQVAQSMVLVTAVQVFLATGGADRPRDLLHRGAGRHARLGLLVLGAGQDPGLGGPGRVLGPAPGRGGHPYRARRRGLQGHKAGRGGGRAVSTGRRRAAVPARVRVPADVERPDRVLAGLTARQLALLAVAAVALWAAYLATPPGGLPRRLRGRRPPARRCGPLPRRRPGRGRARRPRAGPAWRQWQAPARLVPAPDGARHPLPSWPAAPGHCRHRCACRCGPSGPTGSSTWAPTARPCWPGPVRSPSRCAPRANKRRWWPASPAGSTR